MFVGEKLFEKRFSPTPLFQKLSGKRKNKGMYRFIAVFLLQTAGNVI